MDTVDTKMMDLTTDNLILNTKKDDSMEEKTKRIMTIILEKIITKEVIQAITKVRTVYGMMLISKQGNLN